MTSVGGSQYWCYQCNRTVRPSTDDIICPDCNDGFVEEVDNSSVAAATVATGGGADGPPTHLPDTYPFPGGQPAFLQVLEAMSAVLQQMQGPQAGQEGGEGEAGGDAAVRGRPGPGPGGGGGGGGGDIFLLQGQMQNFFGGGGNVEVFFDNGTGNPRRLPGNFGDYFLGPGLDQLIQQLAENDPNRYGAPPASKSAVEAMPTIQISHEHLGTDAAQCAVCKDEFEIGAQVRQMPCKHMYHGDCILPWLAQHNSCPVCRYEMPTDDTDYNQARSSQQSNSSAVPTAAPNSGNTQPGADAGPATPAPSGGGGGGGRRFSIQLPWPFRSSAPPPAPAPSGQAESSASGAHGASSAGGGGPNRGSEGGQRTDDDGDHTMFEARQEDLD
ncbi:unnamed protein product [Sphagnum jensenii]|uniref:RING-type E3 ubiquitin transferase n=1 Tax=Sphagnum jensenii TaxID=128206 RepID=A0ABP0XBK4_9BRYO